MTSRVALVTCAALPHLEDDDLPLVAALERLGQGPFAALWDDPAVRWGECDAVVLRSPIDYVARLGEFLGWATSVERLHNAFPLVRWNTDKAYLRDLEDDGLAVIDTRWLAPGEPLSEPAERPLVVKPAVGVGGIGVGRYAAGDAAAAAAHVRRLHDAGQIALVQPYLESVEDAGEISVVYVDGAYSHAVRRAGFVPEEDVPILPCRADPRQRVLADRVVAYLEDRFGTPLYARIDLLETPSGPAVNEVEVTDPILHLRHAPGSADRLARAIVERMGRDTPSP